MGATFSGRITGPHRVRIRPPAFSFGWQLRCARERFSLSALRPPPRSATKTMSRQPSHVIVAACGSPMVIGSTCRYSIWNEPGRQSGACGAWPYVAAVPFRPSGSALLYRKLCHRRCAPDRSDRLQHGRIIPARLCHWRRHCRQPAVCLALRAAGPWRAGGCIRRDAAGDRCRLGPSGAERQLRPAGLVPV